MNNSIDNLYETHKIQMLAKWGSITEMIILLLFELTNIIHLYDNCIFMNQFLAIF